MSSRATAPRRRNAPRFVALGCAGATAVLAGCTSLAEPEPEPTGWSTAVAAGTAAAQPASRGAIYQRTYYAALVENPTARRVGDLVTVRLEERTTAAKSAAWMRYQFSNDDACAPRDQREKRASSCPEIRCCR